jgi:hypothetical protein
LKLDEENVENTSSGEAVQLRAKIIPQKKDLQPLRGRGGAGRTVFGMKKRKNAAGAEQLASKKGWFPTGDGALWRLCTRRTNDYHDSTSTRLTSLLTTSVFVFVVAIALTWYMQETESKDVIRATAAYAAVLGVYGG